MSNIEFKDNSVEVKKNLNQAGLNWIEEVCSEIESGAKRNSRVDTGKTKKAWTHEVDSNGGKGYVGNPDENALWEELGTGEYAVEGNGRKGAWYVPCYLVTGKKKPTYNGEVVVVYSKKGTAMYKTNGKKPSYALTKAFETTKPKALSRAKSIFGGA